MLRNVVGRPALIVNGRFVGYMESIEEKMSERFDGSMEELDICLDRPATRYIDYCNIPHPKKVIFHEPATIVYWMDGTKTVVKCTKDDEFDPQTGYMIAFIKRIFGNHKIYKKAVFEADAYKEGLEKWEEKYSVTEHEGAWIHPIAEAIKNGLISAPEIKEMQDSLLKEKEENNAQEGQESINEDSR